MQHVRAVRTHDSFDMAYVTVAAVLAVLLAIQTLNQQWSRDFWLHLATVRAYATHPLHPLEPFTGVNIRDPLLSPSMFASGLALLALASTVHWLKGRGVGHLVVVGLSVPIVLLTHPLTAIWAAVFGAALVLGVTNREETGRDARRLAILAALVAGGF